MVDVRINSFKGLWQGPVDHKASSVINAIFQEDPISMDRPALIGDAVVLFENNVSDELLPRIGLGRVNVPASTIFYGIIVGGDREGIYPDTGDTIIFGRGSSDVVALTGDGIRVCTQGRCLARVVGNINVGDPLSATNSGETRVANPGEYVFARALQPLVAAPGVSYVAVDIQREGNPP